jgi:signal transduction histidine kinase
MSERNQSETQSPFESKAEGPEMFRELTVELERAKTELEKRIREAAALQQIADTLMVIAQVEEFWHKLDLVLLQICQTIRAEFAIIFVSTDPDNRVFTVRSVAGLPRDRFVGKSYSASDQINRAVSESFCPQIVSVDLSIKGSFAEELFLLSPDSFPYRVALVPFKLNANQNAILAFFVGVTQDKEASVDLEHNVALPAQVAPQIATAFHNCLLYEQMRELDKMRIAWLEDISHQLIAPLSALQADADRLVRFFDQWDKERVLNHLNTIQGISRWAARLIRNFGWAARTGHIATELTNTRWTRLKPFLIGCAIDVRGMAATKRLRVHVDESIDESWDIRIDRIPFGQAIGNLLDNAVKYANDNTEVRIRAALTDSDLRVSITNYGIPIEQEDVERSFVRGYRTEAAKAKVVVGTGIGLFIAREIVRLHGGDIIVGSSIFNSEWGAHEATFMIRLPRSVFRGRK